MTVPAVAVEVATRRRPLSEHQAKLWDDFVAAYSASTDRTVVDRFLKAITGR